MLQPQNFVQRRLNGPELMNYPFWNHALQILVQSSGTGYVNENKLELNVALGAKDVKQSKFSHSRPDTGLAKINVNH